DGARLPDPAPAGLNETGASCPAALSQRLHPRHGGQRYPAIGRQARNYPDRAGPACCLPEAASCPQAPSISVPRVSRTVTGIPRAARIAWNSRATTGSDAVHRDPGVGLSGMRFTCARLPPSSRARASARQAWSLTLRIIAYSMEPPRHSRIVPGSVEHLGYLPALVARHQLGPRTVVGREQGDGKPDRQLLGGQPTD